MGDPSSSQIPTPKHHQGIPRSASHPRVGKEHKSHKKWHHLRYLSRKEGIKEKLRSNNQCFKPGESFSSYDGGFIISNPTLISTTINRIKLPSPTPSPTPTPTPTPAPPATPTPAEPSPEPAPAPAPAPAPTAAPTPTPTPTRFQKLRSQRSKTPTPITFTEQERQENRRNPTQRSVTPTPKSTDLLASLRENLSEDIATTSTSKRIPPMGAHRDATPLWSRMASKQYAAPIIYSHSTSTVRRKPPPIEKNLACTLEELCFGGVKKIKITRDVLSNLGVMVQEEILTINIKPGWKQGTKITFEGKGDERPGTLPADITFIIDEKRHHLFKRLGNDLMLGVEIPLVQALTGCTITVPLLGEGKEMELSFDDTILYPGYEKIIPDQGMPKPKGNGSRGDLRLQFLVEFPEELSDEQRSEFVSILEDCS